MNKFVAPLIWALSLTAAASTVVRAAEIAGAGSTFVYPVLSKWSALYKGIGGNTVSYQSVGSGRGLIEIKDGTVDFGASDMPLKADELTKLGLGQFPLVIGGVVPVINIDGVKPGQLKFTGPVLADIFLGKIHKWNDPVLQALNPDVKLPDAAITVIHRSDRSGTTFNWVNYLSKASSEWRDKVGEGTSVDWPIREGARGNEGVAEFVGLTKNSIGYVEYAYAHHYNMTFGLVQNKAGRFVMPAAESFEAAAQGVDWTSARDFYLVMTDADGEQAYPITGVTFILMYKEPKDVENSKVALQFFRWALEEGQEEAQKLDYVPLPPPLVKQIEGYWKATIDVGK